MPVPVVRIRKVQVVNHTLFKKREDLMADSLNNIQTATSPSFREAFNFWVKLGFISFGGPTGQIAIMQTEMVERRRWISPTHFLHALNYCMLLPGPEAIQLAIYIGWLLHRTLGGLVAGVFFLLPSVFILLALSYIYAAYGQVAWIAALFYGLKPAVLAIVAHATLRIGAKALRHPLMYGLAAAAFIALFFFKVPFPLVIAGSAATGFLGVRFLPQVFKGRTGAADEQAYVISDNSARPEYTRPSLQRAARVTGFCLLLWVIPLLFLGWWQAWHHVFFQEALFFSKAAMVTFGGAYAVLPYVAQQAVEKYAWLSTGQMIDGLGLAETTPGPLIMVLQFVGFMAGWHQAQDLGLWGAVLGGLIATYFTFMPCFFWIFLGAPYMEQIRGNRFLSGALAAITAGVVGVVLNLAIWFGLNVLFPVNHGLDWFAVGVAVISFIAMQKFKLDIIPVVAGAASLGLIYRILFW
jgi:chromate transporter